MKRKREIQTKKIEEMKLKEDLKKFEGDLKNLDLNKTKEENIISKNFFQGQKVEINLPSKNVKTKPQKNEVIIEDVIEEEKI